MKRLTVTLHHRPVHHRLSEKNKQIKNRTKKYDHKKLRKNKSNSVLGTDLVVLYWLYCLHIPYMNGKYSAANSRPLTNGENKYRFYVTATNVISNKPNNLIYDKRHKVTNVIWQQTS